jgi:hypothetical protein|tara:strand:+ start:13182 stop:13421 length:240 start_codon:yes stop_codon:yes gene_type:complete
VPNESDVGCHVRSLFGRFGDRRLRRRPPPRERQGASPPLRDSNRDALFAIRARNLGGAARASVALPLYTHVVALDVACD